VPGNIVKIPLATCSTPGYLCQFFTIACLVGAYGVFD
jgi:hypothetical protein